MTVTRVVPILLMSCGLPGRYDSAKVFVAKRHDDEQDAAASHSDCLDQLLAVLERPSAVCQTLGADVVDRLGKPRLGFGAAR